MGYWHRFYDDDIEPTEAEPPNEISGAVESRRQSALERSERPSMYLARLKSASVRAFLSPIAPTGIPAINAQRLGPFRQKRRPWINAA
jgi:hypothetical protein